ncbi:nucleotide-binding alpha-beta plait domain-containing protein [Tanacetum coccineum]
MLMIVLMLSVTRLWSYMARSICESLHKPMLKNSMLFTRRNMDFMDQHREDDPVRSEEDRLQVIRDINSSETHLRLKADLVEHIWQVFNPNSNQSSFGFLMAYRGSREDEVNKISTSIFVTNFPDQFYAKDLWKTCNQYGSVVDAFIPNRRSKAGKRFGFVSFVKVFDIDRLVNNLCTIWVDRYKLHANKARFQRPPQKNSSVQYPKKEVDKPVTNVGKMDSGGQGYSNSYIYVVRRGTQAVTVEEESTPVLVLDESCLNQNEFSTYLMGKVKEFSSLTNLKVVLANEGFDNIKLKYMGEYSVMIEFQSEELKDKFKANVSTRSWFSHLQQASSLFQNEERVTWLDIEGVPLKFWTKETSNKIASKWGDLLHVDDEDETCFHSKRICIKTKLVENIFESFNIFFKGKVFWVRAKEVSGWIPDFVEEEEDDTDSEDEIRKANLEDENDDNLNYEDVAADSEVEEVSETIFEKEQSQAHNTDECNIGQLETRLEDPFNIYDLLNKKQENIN